MSEKSAIEWTDATWNPTTGCTKVSPACANCYIERTPPFRIRGRKFVKGHIPMELHPNRLDAPLHRKKPTMYFVNSLSDLFHVDVPDAFIARVFTVMAQCPQHTFQILTKRADRMLNWFMLMSLVGAPDELIAASRGRWPLPNVWVGVSVENQHFADERIPLLLKVPAAVRFLSVEPMLGPVSFRWAKWDNWKDATGERRPVVNQHDGLRMLDWIIVGAESGPRVRPTDPAWVREIRDQCVAANVPFFFKQWGGKTAKSGGRVLDGRTWDDMPARQEASL